MSDYNEEKYHWASFRDWAIENGVSLEHKEVWGVWWEAWKAAIDAGDVLILPKDVAEAKDWHGQLDTQGVLSWLNYLEDEMFMMIGMPKVILGGSSETEGDKKM